MDTAAIVNGVLEVEERKMQKRYWEEHSRDLTVEAMMLDSRAADIDKEERPERVTVIGSFTSEYPRVKVIGLNKIAFPLDMMPNINLTYKILSLLPSYEGKSILELGAGISRFTSELAKTAGHVLAMDFIESVIKKNESINGHHENASFMCADVTSPDLKIEDNSIDLIFSNWLLMYLSDEEVEKLVERMVKCFKVGGYFFFRESCFHQSGDSKRKVNPTHYREPRFYTKNNSAVSVLAV
ncbi:hypothetical protein GUJ93_ZPchr0012g19297 [Zizania palustris]|uniref:Methyltransferase type 11 domain-containing protein n=1 Tax=Zizania palustris TaxID=103762 RepID=A0A8J5WR13_ZIZPA|nr:hypothetical protein GUJ93_ZPchr0012g19297 [Zizania palustris]